MVGKVRIRNSREDIIFNTVIYTLFTGLLIVVVYPLYQILIASVSDPVFVAIGEVTLWPKGFSLDSYKRIFQDPQILTGYRNSAGYTLLGSLINVSITLLIAFPLSRPEFKARKVVMVFLVITMYFHGGLIPTYILVSKLGLVGKWPVMVILNAAGVWNIIIARTFMQTAVPTELYESAKIDGCNDSKFFISVVLPLCKALIAIQFLFYGVRHWNDFFTALIYLRDEELYPLQLILREIFYSAQVSEEMLEGLDAMKMEELIRVAEAMKYGLIIVAAAPLLVVYPFVQRHFVKGVLIGSIKG